MKITSFVLSFAMCGLLLTGCSNQTITMDPNAQKSLKEAEDKLNFKVLVPKSLPNNMKLTSSMTAVNPNTGKPDSITLQFVSPDNKFHLDVLEKKGDSLLGGLAGSSEKELTINNTKAKYQKSDKFTGLVWKKGEVVLFATVATNSELASEDTLVKIAKSFE